VKVTVRQRACAESRHAREQQRAHCAAIRAAVSCRKSGRGRRIRRA
jgi:hypothetical protein